MPTPTARPQQTHRPAKAVGRLGAGRVGALRPPRLAAAGGEAAALRHALRVAALLGAVAAGLVPAAAAAEEPASAAAPTARPGGDGTPQGVAIAAPDAIPARDRGDVETEIAAIMDMTPPERRVRLDLPSGSRLHVRPSGFLVGSGGPDCRRIEYSYEGLGTAVFAVGERCRQPNGLWTAAFADALVSPPPGVEPGDWPPPGPDEGPIGAPRTWPPGDESGSASPSPARDVLAFSPGGGFRGEPAVGTVFGSACGQAVAYTAATAGTKYSAGAIVNTAALRTPLSRTCLREKLERIGARTRGLGSHGSGGGSSLRLRAGDREALSTRQA